MLAFGKGIDAGDIETYFPDDPEVFAFGLQILAGAIGEEGKETFDLFVVSPKWILFNSEEKIFMGRHYLIMLNYNLDRLKNFIVSYVESCTGDTWQEVTEKLGRLGKWEFEDYQEYRPTDS